MLRKLWFKLWKPWYDYRMKQRLTALPRGPFVQQARNSGKRYLIRAFWATNSCYRERVTFIGLVNTKEGALELIRLHNQKYPLCRHHMGNGWCDDIITIDEVDQSYKPDFTNTVAAYTQGLILNPQYDKNWELKEISCRN